MIGRWCPPRRVPTVSLSLRARVCHPNTRTYVRLLGPCFKTGPVQPFRPRHDVSDPRRVALTARHCTSAQPATGARGYHQPEGWLPLPRPSAASRADENLGARTEHPPVGGWKMRAPNTGCIGFPFSDFRHSLTLFSKFFASFPHGTCSLSVSRQYLALEGIYLPIRAAVPSNSTLRTNGVQALTWHERDCHPPWFPVPREFDQASPCRDVSRLQFGARKGPRFSD